MCSLWTKFLALKPLPGFLHSSHMTKLVTICDDSIDAIEILAFALPSWLMAHMLIGPFGVCQEGQKIDSANFNPLN